MDPNSVGEQIVSILRENTWLIPLIAAFIGGMVAGCLTLLGVIVNHSLDLKKKKLEEKQELKNFYTALLVEFTEIWESYNRFGSGIEIEIYNL